jgi:hypothetical protein
MKKFKAPPTAENSDFAKVDPADFSIMNTRNQRKITAVKKKRLIFESFAESDEYYYGMYDIQENFCEVEEEFNN